LCSCDSNDRSGRIAFGLSADEFELHKVVGVQGGIRE
jgi:hypothetical protein